LYFLKSVAAKETPDQQLYAMRKSIACLESFQYTRFSDGELFMLLGKEIKLTPIGAWIDGKKVNSQAYELHDCKTFYPAEDSQIVSKLQQAISFDSPFYIKGLPLPCCVGPSMFRDLLLCSKQEFSFYSTANLLINANYPYFIEKVLPIITTRPLIIVANKRADLSTFSTLIHHTRLGDDSKLMLETFESDIAEKLISLDIDSQRTVIILFAASYISNILIHRLSLVFPHVTMIDIGTALHPLIGLGFIRHYLQLYWSNPSSYSYHQCSMKLL